MAEFDELKHIVMSFRVSELQVLLGYAGCNKSGRKQELLHRALALVEKGCSHPVKAKIRDLYRQICSTNQRRRLDGPGGMVTGEIPPPVMVSAGMAHFGQSLTGGALEYSSKNLAAPVDSLASPIPVHPDVRLKPLAFYELLDTLQKPTSLMPNNANKMQTCYFHFHLTPEEAKKIALSRDCRPSAECEYAIQVQMRFCLLETSCRQDDNFPPNVSVRVNGCQAQLPNLIPTNKPGMEPKRPGRPVDITRLCRISPTQPNHLEVNWSSELGRGYCLSLYLVKRLSTMDLLQQLKQGGFRHPDYTRALIKEKLAHDPDSEVATTSLRVSLICPLGKMRMSNACRSSTCTHLQCFDAQSYLLMNERKPTWVCPVCDKPAPFNSLLIDGYYAEIFWNSPESNDIVFHEDGSWTSVKLPKETHIIANQSTPIAISLNDNDSACGAPLPSTSQKGVRRDVIDLTMDTSDEEDDVTMTKKTDSDTPMTITPGPSHISEASSSSSCMSPAVINVDAPSPALSVHSLSASPAPLAVSHSQTPFSSPAPSASVLAAPPSAHSFQPSCANVQPHFNPQTNAYLPPQPVAPAGPPLMVPAAVQGHLGEGIGRSHFNLEDLSEAEFDTFLHGLSWEV